MLTGEESYIAKFKMANLNNVLSHLPIVTQAVQTDGYLSITPVVVPITFIIILFIYLGFLTYRAILWKKTKQWCLC